MNKQQLLYSGKAKSVYATDDPDRVVLAFRNDTSAFDGQKVEQLADKGRVNNLFNAFIMEKLAEAGIPTHFERSLSDTESLVKNLDMIPLESVVRNVAAGSLCRRLGIEEGKRLTPPTYELFLKNDALHDPMVNESLAVSLGWADQATLQQMQTLSFQVNEVLAQLFDAGGMTLVDYKLEFGISHGVVTLGDEFSPDGCRIWDKATGEKMDKDRFRQNLGNVIDFYKEVARRLGLDL